MSHTRHDLPEAGIGIVTFRHIFIMAVLNWHPHPHRWRSSVSTSVCADSSTSRCIQLCRWLRSYLLNVFGDGDRRGQEDGRELESGCGRDPYICASLSPNLVRLIDYIVIDWFILGCRRILDLSIDPGYSTEPTGHFQLLSCEHLSDSCRPQSIKCYNLPPCFPTPIFTTDIRSLGERPLVPELGDQSHMCSTRDVAAAVGKTISQGHSVTLQPAQALTDSCVPCRRS